MSLTSLLTLRHQSLSWPPSGTVQQGVDSHNTWIKIWGAGQVGAGSRVPASVEDDSHRFVVAGKLFASYANEIRYGVLSLNGNGLKNYGRVFVRLKDIAIKQRTSFLVENSYHFVDKHCKSMGAGIPAGYRSDWGSRHKLVASKLESVLEKGSKVEEWANALVRQGATRNDDDFIEAHVFSGFNADAFDSIVLDESGALRQERTDIAVVGELFGKLLASRGRS